MTTPWRYVAGALRRSPGPLVRLAVWSTVEALPALISGYATARAVDDGFLAHRPAVGLGWLGLYAAAAGLGAAGSRGGYRCLGAIVEPFRDGLDRRVVAGALRHSTAPGGRADTASVARLTHQVEIVRDTFAGLLTVVRSFLFAVIAALLGLLSLAPLLAVLVLAPLVVGLGIFVVSIPAMAARQRAYVRADERLAEESGALLGAHRDVVACGAQRWAVTRAGVPVEEEAAAERALARMGAVRILSLAIGGWLPLVVVLAAAPLLVRHGVAAGAVLGALVYVVQGLQPALHTLIQGIAGGGLRFGITLGRILAASEPPAAPGRPAAMRGNWPVDGGLVLSGVEFRYGPRADPVLDGFDLDLPDGGHLAIVGASGIGKSTLAGLMAGLLRPRSGQVRLGGVPLDELPDVARHRVLIPQEAYIFSGTVEENLTYLSGATTRMWLDIAVDAVGAGPLVERLGGYPATVDPATLSAGERQLIALVRAYLSPARLVILDEASAHLDPPTEARAENAFASRPGSLVVIAHRISSARRARRILLFDGVHVVEGSHDELLAGSARYRELVGSWDATDAKTPV